MASKSVNITISTPLGDLQIYTDPKEQARAERLIAETPSIMRNAYDRATEKFGNQLLRLVKKCLRTGTPPRGTHWDPHSANTIKRYGEHTLLNYTGQYLRSVQIVKQKNRTYVGIPTNLKKTKESIQLAHGRNDASVKGPGNGCRRSPFFTGASGKNYRIDRGRND